MSGPSAARTTLMRFSVRVPVLSEQMTVAPPRVSTAGRRRTSASCLAMRCTPSAMTMVAVAGRLSGITEMASEIARSSIGAKGRP